MQQRGTALSAECSACSRRAGQATRSFRRHMKHAPHRIGRDIEGRAGEMDDAAFFENGFAALTGNAPLGWQRRLFEDHFARGTTPAALDIPTGLGKTSVIPIWLLAVAWQVGNGGLRLPRRLIYVVNRRTVVDQATDVAGELRKRLQRPKTTDSCSKFTRP
jgi:hypothetical protein